MFEVNDILVSKFGYNCTLVTFYKVLRKTKSGKTVTLTRLNNKVVDDDGYGQAGFVIPGDKYKEILPPKRITITNDGEGCVKIDNYEFAYKWDNEPVYFDSYD